MTGWEKKLRKLDDCPEIVPYLYFWITLENWAPTRKVCFAVLAAASRYGVSCLHPRKEGGRFQISVASSAGCDLMKSGSYTLSGIMRIAQRVEYIDIVRHYNNSLTDTLQYSTSMSSIHYEVQHTILT